MTSGLKGVSFVTSSVARFYTHTEIERQTDRWKEEMEETTKKKEEGRRVRKDLRDFLTLRLFTFERVVGDIRFREMGLGS